MTPYRSLIIGSGNIGAFFDRPGSPHILTHANAYVSHENFELVAFIDGDIAKARKAASVWGGEAFRDIGDAMAVMDVDVASVCTPTDLHYSVLRSLKDVGLKGILLEKPISDRIEDSRVIVREYSMHGPPVIVNYLRRFVREFETLRSRISSGEFGKYISGHCYYGKGILNNGSHVVDLLSSLIGEIKGWKATSGLMDYNETDPTVTASLFFEDDGIFQLIETDQNNYHVLEIDLFFARKRIQILDSGFQIVEHDIVQDAVWKGYRRLKQTGTAQTSLGRAIFHAVDNMARVIEGREEIKCTLEDALGAQELCHKIKDDFLKAKR